MNCPKCGSEIAAGHQFCMNCGYSLIRETPAERREEPEPAPEAGKVLEEEEKTVADPEPEQVYRRRRVPQEDGPEEEAEEPAEEPAPEPAYKPRPAPVRTPAQAQAPAQARPSMTLPPVRYQAPARNKPERAVPPAEVRKYRRSSGKGAMFWVGILLLVLTAVYVGACILIPDHDLTAPAVNLALTVWSYFSACGTYLLWFPIALGAIILLAILKATAGRALHRKLHDADTSEAQDLARIVVVAETLAPPQQVYAEIDEALKNRKTRKRYFPGGKFELEEFTGGSVPLEYSHGDDGFTANFVFQRMDRAGTRIFLEIIEWQIVNDAVSRRCLEAMRGLEPMLRDVVLDIDTGARFQVYDR